MLVSLFCYSIFGSCKGMRSIWRCGVVPMYSLLSYLVGQKTVLLNPHVPLASHHFPRCDFVATGWQT